MFAIPCPVGRGILPAVRPIRTLSILALAAAAGLAACSSGGGSSSSGTGGNGGGTGDSGDGGINGEDGGDYAPPGTNGDTVAVLETEAPAADEFVLRGTFPVPPGVFPRSDDKMLFSVVDHDGTALLTQNEVVTRYANADDGADVVEVIARVHRDPQASPGSRVQYRVEQVPHSNTPSFVTPGPEDLINATQDLPQSVRDLLSDPGAMRVSATDFFGNEYACYPLGNQGKAQVEKYGTVLSQVQSSQVMEPEPVVTGSNGTLKHFLGVHSYLTTMQGEDVVLLDLRVHNAHSGNNQSKSLDDPLDKVYFEELEIAVPSGWVLQQDFDDPYFGSSYSAGSKTVHPIVEPLGDGTMHVIRWQGQFHRRLALSPAASADRARMYLDGHGRGFCRRGTDPDSGKDYWSWWNDGTDRYFPACHQLPSLEHVGMQSLRNTLAGDLAWLRGHLENGTNTNDDYPIQAPVLGWGHPYGVAYGGMTAGTEIVFFDGVEVAESASREGYRLFEGTHRMQTDRQPNALYDLDGEPSRVEDWVEEDRYVPFNFYGVPFIKPGDPFGLDQAEQFQIQAVEAAGEQPYYEAQHLNFDPHDIQHLVRYTRSPKVLAWLGNDALAKDDLRMQAETAHLSYHHWDNGAFGGKQQTSLAFNVEDVAADPGKGFNYGRGEGWILETMVAAYACSDPAWRQEKEHWFGRVTNLLSDGQATCSGFIQSIVVPKFFNEKYHGRQMIEQSITENAIRAMRETVFRDADPALFAMAGEVLADTLFASISDMAWYPGESAPWSHTANAPKDPTLPVYCSLGEIPPDGHTTIHEAYQNWSCFAYGYDLTGDTSFLDKARLQTGANDLLNGLQAGGIGNIGNQAAILALAQRMAGQL